LARDALSSQPSAWRRFRAAQRGRAVAWKTRHTSRSAAGASVTGQRRAQRPTDRGLRVLRVVDVPGVATAGMSGYVLSSSEEMERWGHRLSVWFRDQLLPLRDPSGRRRRAGPWLIVGKVVTAPGRGERFVVVEIHEPLSGPYGALARLCGPRLP